MTYINNPKYFTKSELKKNAEKNQFTDLRPVEKFLWDCEIASLLQRKNEKIILKGGVAVQLYLPLELQRASIDIDLVSPLSETDFEHILDEVAKQGGYAYSVYTPKNPEENIPLKTYIFEIPNLLEDEGTPTSIKIDVLYDYDELPLETVRNVETFALEIDELTIYKKTTLIGDKILTLAENTVGVKDLSSYPKQIYDVYQLLINTAITEESLNEIIHSFILLSKKEKKYRKYDGEIKNILEDIINSLSTHSSMDTSKYDGDMKKHIESFQAYYLSSSQRKARLYDWSYRFNTIKYLVNIILEILNKKITTIEGVIKYNKALKIEKKLSQTRGDDLRKTITTLLGFADYLPYYKELRGKPVNRVFWEVVTINNVEIIEEKCPA